jgi:hypothetical protein
MCTLKHLHLQVTRDKDTFTELLQNLLKIRKYKDKNAAPVPEKVFPSKVP